MILRILAIFLAVAPGVASAQATHRFSSEHHDFRLVAVADGLEHPWSLAFLPDGRMLVTEREGALRLVSKDGWISPPVQDLPPIWARGQGGLLDVALDPDYRDNNLIYLSFSEPGNGVVGTAAMRARLDADAGRVDRVRILFRQQPKSSGGRHFGSRLAFGQDGALFITTGDRGERDRNQDFDINRGQVIRIATDGTIPPDNPFVDRPGYRPEVWSYGHRNPQGAARHPITGKLWLHEHGAAGGDEINIPAAGGNYGWPTIAYGRHYSGGKIGVGTAAPGYEQPIYYWDPSIAPSGMAFYTGDKFPRWKGNLFIGALKYRLLVRLTLDGERVVGEERLIEDFDERIRDVRQGPDGFIYLLTDDDPGRIVRLEPIDG